MSESIKIASKRLSNKSIVKLSLFFGGMFFFFAVDKLYIAKKREIDLFALSSKNYMVQLLKNSDSFELVRNLNSYIKGGIIDEFIVLDIKNDTTLLHSYSDSPMFTFPHKKVPLIDLKKFTYSIMKEVNLTNRYRLYFLKSHSLFLVGLHGIALLLGIGIVILVLVNNIKYVSNRISEPIEDYERYLDRFGNNDDKKMIEYQSKFTEVNKVHKRIILLRSKLLEQAEVEARAKKSQALDQIASQVSHDIRSPLAALNMISNEIDLLPETTRLMLRGSVNRIQDIANNLLQAKNGKNKKDEVSLHLLSPIIEQVISEKRTALRAKPGIAIDSSARGNYGLFVKVDQSHLKRIISNLINNSVEALKNEAGNILITYIITDKNVEITISDNGKGIPESIISKLGNEGASFGKESNSESGSGLGLFHAKKSLQKWKGNLDIKSEEGKGTDIVIALPLQAEPSWFVSKLDIKTGQNIVIADDDSSIHQVWDKKLKNIVNERDISVIHISNPDDLKNWIKTNSNSDTIYLCDYEFIGHKANGLDLIEELNLSQNAILVTSRYEEEEVRSRCEKLGVKLIPKMMAEMVLIELVSSQNSFIDLVHVDDDELVRMSWQFGAKKEGKEILSFVGPNDLMNSLNKIPKSTPFYIDSSLGEGVVAGQDLAKELFELGFKELYMSTGYKKENFEGMPWIKGILGKEAPWVDSSFS